MAENHYDTNPYHYVLNNPMSYMDYMGLDNNYNGGSLKEIKITGPAKGTGSGNSYYGYGSGWGGYDPFDTDNGYGSGDFGSFSMTFTPPPPPVLSSSAAPNKALDNRGFDSLDALLGISSILADGIKETKMTISLLDGSGGLKPNYYLNGWNGNQFVQTAKVSKLFSSVSTKLGYVGLGISTYQIAKGAAEPITYVDAAVSTAGIGATIASYYTGVQVPFVGEGVAIYGTIRTGWAIAHPMGQANGLYIESNRRNGKWILNLPH